jgi:cytochrome c oxidase cbb3-type subunit 3
MVKLSFFLIGAALLCLLVFGVAVPVESRAQDTDAAKQDLIKRGALVYKTRCVLCHNAEGKSPNKRMRFADHEWKHGDKPEQVQKVVTEGVKGTAMMGFKNRLNDNDIKAVTAYIMDLSEKAKSE